MNEPTPSSKTLAIRIVGIINCFVGASALDRPDGFFLSIVGVAMIWGSMYLDARQIRERKSPSYYNEM